MDMSELEFLHQRVNYPFYFSILPLGGIVNMFVLNTRYDRSMDNCPTFWQISMGKFHLGKNPMGKNPMGKVQR